MTSVMNADLVIHNGKIVSPDAVIDASIAIKDGRVLARRRARCHAGCQ
jgi:predicted amidohydrolase YtcJ